MKQLIEHGPLMVDGLLGLEFDRLGDGGLVRLDGADDDGDNRELRKELIERVTRGEHIELLLNACTYAQGPGIVVRGYLEMTEVALRGFADRAPGTPFQHSHSLNDRDCGGYCLSSDVEKGAGDVLRLLEGIVLNTPRAVLAALRGNMRKFSISWYWTRRESVLCSLCKKPMLRCDHRPGQEIAGDGGKKATVKLLYTEAWPIERSHVMFPAVHNTGTESWRALSALREEFRRGQAKEPNVMEWNDVIVKLGLGDCAGPADVANEMARLNAEVGELKTKLSANQPVLDGLRAEKAALEDKNATLTARVAELEQVAVQTECDQLVEALADEGRIIPGSARETLIRECYGDGNIAFAEKLAAQYREEAPLVPVAASTERQSSPAAELNARGTQVARGEGGEVDYAKLFASLPDHVREMAGPLASEPERFIKSNPKLCAELGLNEVPTNQE